MRGAYGEIDYDRKVIKVNPKRHKSKKVRRLTSNKDGTENLLVTMLHEEVHRNHPKMHERNVEKLARAMKSRMGDKAKKKTYRKFK